MALWNIKNVKLAGVAGAVPDKVVDTHDFDFFNREEADVFIEYRRYRKTICRYR